MTNRKLQTEIERACKKVVEGEDEFNEIWDKLYATENTNQKEKYEQDLKREIKKLQRYRDQIKSWIASNDVKDKNMLVDFRKRIESLMERFKTCEKEMKTKAYSKEGLAAAGKLDPKERGKLETQQWLSQAIDSLSTQNDQAEAELESMEFTIKKSSKKDVSRNERQQQLEHLIMRNKYHIQRMEIILRMLVNGTLEADKVNIIKDDIEYYIEANQEPNFEENEDLYEDLNLQEFDDDISTEDHFSDEGGIDESEVDGEETKAENRPLVSETIKSAKEKLEIEAESEVKKEIDKLENETNRKPKSTVTTTALSLTVTTQKPLTRDSRSFSQEKKEGLRGIGALGNVAGISTSAKSLSSLSPLSVSGSSTRQTTVTAAQPTKQITGFTHIQPQQQISSFKHALLGQQSNSSNLTVTAAQRLPSVWERDEVKRIVKDSSPMLGASNSGKIVSVPTKGPVSKTAFSSLPLQNGLQTGVIRDKSLPERQVHGENDLDDTSKYSDMSLNRLPFIPSLKPEQLTFLQQSLISSFQQRPDIQDLERSKYYIPQHPFATSLYYPNMPAPIFENPAIFQKFDLGTLFFIFYYQQGIYQQYWAARELKRQGWRFHKKYQAWFQRDEDPKYITDEYEQGTYLYFDYETNWCIRKKPEFTFEYMYLEHDEVL